MVYPPNLTDEERLILREPVDRVASLLAEQLADSQVGSVGDQVLRYSILAEGVLRLKQFEPDSDSVVGRAVEQIVALATRFSDATVASEIVADESTYGRFHWRTSVLCIGAAPELLGPMIRPLVDATLAVRHIGPDLGLQMQSVTTLAHLQRRAVEDGHKDLVERLAVPLKQLAVTPDDLSLRIEGIGALLRDRSSPSGVALLATEIGRLQHDSDPEDLELVFGLAIDIPRQGLFDPIRIFVAQSLSTAGTVPKPARAALAAYQRRWPQPLAPLGGRN